MSGLIVYSSVYGTTKTYAEKLGELLGWPVQSCSETKSKQLNDKQKLVVASNIRIGKLGAKKWISKNKKALGSIDLMILAVGGEKAENQTYYKESVRKNLDFLNLSDEQIVGLGGRKIRADFNRKDTFLFNMLDKMVKDPKDKEDILKDVDHVDMSLLDPIAERLKK